MKAGDKVVCINATRNPNVDHSTIPNWVEEGATYIIRRIESALGGVKRVLLEEIRNPRVYIPAVMADIEPGFASNRFVLYEDYVLGNVEQKEEEYELHAN